MKIIFLTMSTFKTVRITGIYSDLVRHMETCGNEIYIVCPIERRNNIPTTLYDDIPNVHFLRVKTGNIFDTYIIEKGISTVMIKAQFIHAINKYLKNIKFDLILYSTPPVTLAGVVKYLKKRDNAKTYLMLKDIFPQNAVDYGMMKKTGAKSVVYRFFRSKEKELYKVSDYIGCTSPENIRYILKNNPEIPPEKVELCINCMEPSSEIPDIKRISDIRDKYSIPRDRIVFLYGGNFGVPQGIDFILKCIQKTNNIPEAFFLFIGSGTEEDKLLRFVQNNRISNVEVRKYMPTDDFNVLASACDVGMIFLDYRTTTPNTPARFLSYMNAGIPILAVTDPCTDIGDIIVNGGFGWKCYSNDVDKYYETILKIMNTKDWERLKKNSRNYLLENYTPEHAYKSIMGHFEE